MAIRNKGGRLLFKAIQPSEPPMTAPSIKEALQKLRNANMSYSLVSDVKNARRLEQAMRDADRALATFQPDGERREAIARTFFGSDPKAVAARLRAYSDRPGIYIEVPNALLTEAALLLASGLVRDNAAIRADEREKCAKIADREAEFWQDAESSSARIVAAAIRSARDGGAET